MKAGETYAQYARVEGRHIPQGQWVWCRKGALAKLAASYFAKGFFVGLVMGALAFFLGQLAGGHWREQAVPPPPPCPAPVEAPGELALD